MPAKIRLKYKQDHPATLAVPRMTCLAQGLLLCLRILLRRKIK
jgi:hypothetical protein